MEIYDKLLLFHHFNSIWYGNFVKKLHAFLSFFESLGVFTMSHSIKSETQYNSIRTINMITKIQNYN